MQVNRALLASILITLVYGVVLLFNIIEKSVGDFKMWNTLLDIFTPAIVYFFSKLAFGDAALNNWTVVAVSTFISLKFILH